MAVLAPPLAASPEAEAERELSVLAERFQRALDQERWKRVVRLGERILELRSDLALVPYRVACAQARLGRREEALARLELAAANGFAGLVSIEGDPELDPLREEPRFRACLERVRAARDARFEPWRREAERRAIPVFVPESAGESPPLILVLHGSGGSGEALMALYRRAAIALGAVLAAPESGRADGPGQSWVFRDEAEWMVLHALERMVEQHRIDERRVILAGFSQGANVTLEVGLRHPERFAALAAMSGHWDPAIVRVNAEAARQPRVHLLIGAEDEWVDTYRAAQRALADAGLSFSLEIAPDTGHAPPPDAERVLERILTALARRPPERERPGPSLGRTGPRAARRGCPGGVGILESVIGRRAAPEWISRRADPDRRGRGRRSRGARRRRCRPGSPSVRSRRDPDSGPWDRAGRDRSGP